MPNFTQQELEVLEFTYNLLNSEKFTSYSPRKLVYIFNYLWDSDFENDEQLASDIMQTYVDLEPMIMNIIQDKYNGYKRIGVHAEHCINLVNQFSEKRSHFIKSYNHTFHLLGTIPASESKILNTCPNFIETFEKMDRVWKSKIDVSRDDEVSKFYFQMVEFESLSGKYIKKSESAPSPEQDTSSKIVHTQEEVNKDTPKWYDQVTPASTSEQPDTQDVCEEPITEDVIEDTTVEPNTQEVSNSEYASTKVEEPNTEELSADMEIPNSESNTTVSVDDMFNDSDIDAFSEELVGDNDNDVYTLQEVVDSIEQGENREQVPTPNEQEDNIVESASQESPSSTEPSEVQTAEPNTVQEEPNTVSHSALDQEISNNLIL